jgi:hypothetical protein
VPIGHKQPDPSGASTSFQRFKEPQLEPKEKSGLQGSQYRRFAIWKRSILEKMFKSRSLSKKIGGQNKKNVFGRTFPANFQKLVLILYGLLKMSHGQQLLDPDPELINAKSLDFAKPKLFFKNIGRYAATSTYIYVRIPFNFSQILDTKNTIEQHNNTLLDKNEEPFKTIAKTMTDVSLITISASIEDFQDVIKALPHTTEKETPGRPKCFVAIGLAIAAMALSYFYAYRIIELNSEIST